MVNVSIVYLLLLSETLTVIHSTMQQLEEVVNTSKTGCMEESPWSLLSAPLECNILRRRSAHLGSTEFGGLDLAGDVTLGSCPEFTEDPDRESCAGVNWL